MYVCSLKNQNNVYCILVKCEIFLECGLRFVIVHMSKRACEEDIDSEYVTLSVDAIVFTS